MPTSSAWIVAVDMGYGHQRAAWPLRHLSPSGTVLNANRYDGIPRRDQQVWEETRHVYEFFSRLSNVSAVGKSIFGAFDYFQRIKPFYPHQNVLKPSLQVRENYYAIHHGFGKHLIDYLNTKPIPLITTFFTVAFCAEEHKFKQDIYLVVCDSDVSRGWVPLRPSSSRIKYLAPCQRVVERLKSYGVLDKNIFLTGFPLPEENIGTGLNILKEDLAQRLARLDPCHRFRDNYGQTVQTVLNEQTRLASSAAPITLTFAVGGAGAQQAIGESIMKSLKPKLLRTEINVCLVAGVRHEVNDYFQTQIKKNGLSSILGKNLSILVAPSKEVYFEKFNELLHHTDILWTKPSELVFYASLGLPIIMSPALGSQEVLNHEWLKTIGAGIAQNNPRATSEWLDDWLAAGSLAQAAFSGFLDGGHNGTSNIRAVVFAEHGTARAAAALP